MIKFTRTPEEGYDAYALESGGILMIPHELNLPITVDGTTIDRADDQDDFIQQLLEAMGRPLEGVDVQDTKTND